MFWNKICQYPPTFKMYKSFCSASSLLEIYPPYTLHVHKDIEDTHENIVCNSGDWELPTCLLVGKQINYGLYEMSKFMCAHRKWSPRHMTKWKSRCRAVCMLSLSDKRDGAGGCAYTDTPYPLECIDYFWGDVQQIGDSRCLCSDQGSSPCHFFCHVHLYFLMRGFLKWSDWSPFIMFEAMINSLIISVCWEACKPFFKQTRNKLKF